MCDVICANMKCGNRLPSGYCGRAYPCSECQPISASSKITDKEYTQMCIDRIKQKTGWSDDVITTNHDAISGLIRSGLE